MKYDNPKEQTKNNHLRSDEKYCITPNKARELKFINYYKLTSR